MNSQNNNYNNLLHKNNSILVCPTKKKKRNITYKEFNMISKTTWRAILLQKKCKEIHWFIPWTYFDPSVPQRATKTTSPEFLALRLSKRETWMLIWSLVEAKAFFLIGTMVISLTKRLSQWNILSYKIKKWICKIVQRKG